MADIYLPMSACLAEFLSKKFWIQIHFMHPHEIPIL